MRNYTNFTCSQDIRDFLEFYINEKGKLGIFDFRKRRELSQIKSSIVTCKQMLEDYTTFESNQFLQFLTKYLSLQENEEYILLDNIKECVSIMVAVPVPHPQITTQEYNIITTAKNYEKLKSERDAYNGLGDTNNINQFLAVCENKKYINLITSSTYSLLHGLSLKDDFSDYPYLADLAYELVDLKLSNPNLSDIERLNIVLSNMQLENSNNTVEKI